MQRKSILMESRRSRAADRNRWQSRDWYPHADYCRVPGRKCVCCWLLRSCSGLQPQLDPPEARRRIRPGHAFATNPFVSVLGNCCGQRRGFGGRAAARAYRRRSVAAPDSLQSIDTVFRCGFEEPGSLVESRYQRTSCGVSVDSLFESLASIEGHCEPGVGADSR